MKFIRHAAFVAAAAILSSPAVAADEAFTQEEIAAQFDIAFGVAVTSRYISRGADNSDGPAFQAYFEPSYGMFYAGVWTSTVDGALVGIDPNDDFEIDFYAGIRPEFGSLALDLGYARYVYSSSGDDCRCGEFYAKATYTFTDQLSAGGEIYYDPEWETTYGVLNAAVVLPYDVTLSAAYGEWLTSGDDRRDWNIGLSYTINDTFTVDGRYHDSNFDHGRFVVMLSVDSSWSALRGK